MKEKQIVARAAGIQKENFGVNIHFPGEIECNFEKKTKYIYIALCLDFLELWLLNNAWLPTYFLILEFQRPLLRSACS